MLILGIFFFQIREQFDSLDLHNLESLKEAGQISVAVEQDVACSAARKPFARRSLRALCGATLAPD